MVISQVAGVFTAFGTGELSGAGFGPNYTILMKLGYEFYAPRILDEMQKSPNRSFEDTKYWRAFQTHIKLYSDKVMTETLDKLLSMPQATIDALTSKWGFDGGEQPSTSTRLQPRAVPGIPSFLTPIISILPSQYKQQIETAEAEYFKSLETPATEKIPEQLTEESKAERAARVKAEKQKIALETTKKLPIHPYFFQQVKSLQNNRNAKLKAMETLNFHIKKQEDKLKNMIQQKNKQKTPGKASGIIIANQKKVIAIMYKNRFTALMTIQKLQDVINEFSLKWRPG